MNIELMIGKTCEKICFAQPEAPLLSKTSHSVDLRASMELGRMAVSNLDTASETTKMKKVHEQNRHDPIGKEI